MNLTRTFLSNRSGRILAGGVATASLLTLVAISGSPATAGPRTAASATTTSANGNRGAADPTGIVVTGVGRVSVVPDTVTLQVGVETTAPKAVTALTTNNQRSATLIKLLKAQGIADRDLQTSQLFINPQYANDGRRITGYSVSNIVTAKVRGVDKAGPLIDAAAGAVGDSIRLQGVSFSISDSTAALAQARRAAVTDGRAQAEALAEAAGVRLGALRRIESSSAPATAVAFQDKSVASAGLSVEAGSQEVSVNVQMVYDFA